MRIHELALQRWLNQVFIFKEGFPVPVIFATPKDAHAEFLRIWKLDNNPYCYLLELKDDRGNPVYNANPPTVIYPLLSVTRLDWRHRVQQSAGYHVNRAAYYPTVQGNGSVTQNDMAWAASLGMPTAWDFRFQIDHYCMFPQTQAVFLNRLMREFRFSGGSPQTFIVARYPFPHQKKYIRAYLESDIQNVSTDANPDGAQEYRTSFNLVLEGFWMDFKTQFNPVLWQLGLGTEGMAAAPSSLSKWFDFHDIYGGVDDVRNGQSNPAIQSRDNLPPSPA